jgi:hypothetical protein
MHYRRSAAILLSLLIALAVCLPERPDGAPGTLRHGNHLSRGTVQAVVVRPERASRHSSAGQRQRRGNARSWSPESLAGSAHASIGSTPTSIRSVDTLPSHWGARHLTI